jgi:hypothetical protein
MPLPLDHWHARLDRHFRSLADARGSGLRIFALEHPLTSSEIGELSSDLRKHIASGLRLGSYWLPWVIYATEIGYGYTGDEYWQSFEEQTPGWEFHHRYLLSNWFQKFQTTYHGVEPSGQWAEHFSLIAWPITHAMLPKLLQYQFASLIYQLRYQLAGLHSLDSLSTGRLLASHGDETSTRFQQFLQQEELTGRILLGLLGLSPTGGPEPIYQPTLQRIVADLNAVRTTRAWLKDVRTVVDRFKGIGQGSGTAANRPRAESVPNKSLDLSVHCDIRPRVFLRHAGGGTWTAALDIPSFAPVAALRTDLRSFLKETRCRVAGASEMKPAGWVLSKNPVAILKSWPNPGAPLLVFDKSHSVLDHLLKTDCVLSPGSFWLFRIGPDGIAREILGRALRPGSDYIVLSAKQLPTASTLSRQCAVECGGVSAFRISLPQHLSAEDMRWLTDAGFQIARSIRVWPAGLPCRAWDGEGRSEWLTTEEPCFGIVHDHPVSSYAIQLNGVNQVVIAAPAEGVPTFVRLRPLPAGRYRLNITAERHGSIADIARSAPPQGFVELLVREPEPWTPGIPAHTGLVVRIDPHDADLDKFWENKVSIIVTGPESHTVDCSVALERSDGEEVFYGPIASRMALPITPEAWQKRFAAFLDKNEEAANWRYPEAVAGRLCIKAGELGEFNIRFHRDIQPVRWLTRHKDDRVRLRLLDDTGLEGDAECEIFGMHNPLATTTSSPTEVLAGISLEPPGALVVARHGEHQDALIVSDGLARQGLQGLGVKPDTSDIESGRTSLASAIRVLCLWLDARLVGPLAEIRRKQVTDKLLAAIYTTLCGKQWAAAERTFIENPATPSSADVLRRKVHSVGGFSLVLERDYARLLEDIDRSVAWYTDLARKHDVCKDAALCEFAVRLAVLPQSLPKRFGDVLDTLVKQAADNRTIILGPRFAMLLCFRFAPAEYEKFSRRQRWQ